MAKIIMEDVRCSYVYVKEPRKKDDGTNGNYGVQLIFPKNHKQVKKLKNIIKEVLVEKFGAKAASQLKRYKLPLRDGDEERDGEEYQGMYFMNANSGKKPGIANRSGEPADQNDIEELCYSGAYFHVSVNIYAFDSKDGGKPGVAVGLNNLMLRKPGERLDGTTSASDDFASYVDDNDYDDDW